MATNGPRPRWRRLLLPVVTVVGLVLVAPVLVDVYSSLGDISTLGPGWLAAMVLATAGQLVAFWELYRIVLRTDRWFDVAVPHLVGNAASHVVPGGGAVGAGLQARLMTIAGFSLTRVMTAFGAIAILGGVANFVVLPLVVLAAERAGQQHRPWSDLRALGRCRHSRGVARRCGGRDACVIDRGAISRGPCPGSTSACIALSDSADLERRLIEERDLIRGALRGARWRPRWPWSDRRSATLPSSTSRCVRSVHR